MVNWIIAIAICLLSIEILILPIIISLSIIKDCVEEIRYYVKSINLSNQNTKKLDKIERIVQCEVGNRHDIERMVLEVIRGGVDES